MFWHIALSSLFALILGLAAAWDLCTGQILNRFSVLLLALGVIRFIIAGVSFGRFLDALGGLAIAAGLMLVISLISDGFGGGDIKLVGAGGFYLGLLPSMFALIISCVLFVFIWLILRCAGKAELNSRMKYGPLYAIGAVISAVLCFV